MAALVQPEELKAYMSGINMNPLQMAQAANILEGVQSELEMYINRSLTNRTIREAVQTDAEGYANLSQSPIQGIVSIALVSNVSLPDMDTTTEYVPEDGPVPPDLIYVPDHFGRDLIVPGGVYLGSPKTYYVIEYTGGGGDFIDPYLPAVKLAIMRVASREFQQMSDDTMSLRDTSATPPVDPIPVTRRGWREDELAQFDRIRRRVIA